MIKGLVAMLSRFCCENFRLLYMNRTENTEDGLERFVWLHNEMLMGDTND